MKAKGETPHQVQHPAALSSSSLLHTVPGLWWSCAVCNSIWTPLRKIQTERIRPNITLISRLIISHKYKYKLTDECCKATSWVLFPEFHSSLRTACLLHCALRFYFIGKMWQCENMWGVRQTDRFKQNLLFNNFIWSTYLKAKECKHTWKRCCNHPLYCKTALTHSYTEYCQPKSYHPVALFSATTVLNRI